MLTSRAHRTSGFTLIEMVVTMGVFALLVALTVPTLRTWIADSKVRAVADGLQNGLRLAQGESLSRSRQIVFSLTNSATPQNGFTAAANGIYWSINTVPSMTDGSETAANSFVQSGVLTSTTANVAITGAASICFNSMGRLVLNTTAGVTGITGGSTCGLPNAPPQRYNITMTGADRPLQVQVALGGQVHLCDQNVVFSSANPTGC